MAKRYKIVEISYIGIFIFIILIFCILLCSCGKTQEPDAKLQYLDIISQQEVIFKEVTENTAPGMFLGMQYYQNEPILLWSESGRKIYLYRMDGSRELLIDNAENAASMEWFLDQDGSFYCWKRIPEENETLYLQKMNSSGEEIFCTWLESQVIPEDICQFEDGNVYILLYDKGTENRKIAEVNTATGIITSLEHISLDQSASSIYIEADGQVLLVLENGISSQISRIRLSDGVKTSAISFAGTSYSVDSILQNNMTPQALRTIDYKTIEILWANPWEAESRLETLKMENIKKEVVIMRALMDPGNWMKNKISEFNRTNDTYHIILEYGNTEAEQADMIRSTNIQIGAGKGPDILYSYLIESLAGAIDKQVFEDLSPYMEASGMKEDDYFPNAFSYCRTGKEIYVMRGEAIFSFLCVNEDLLNSREMPDAETFTEAMLAWKPDAVYAMDDNISRTPCIYILHDFLLDLKGLDELIDWKQGTCSFDSELFSNMLKAAKRYGYSWNEIYGSSSRRGYPGITCNNWGYSLYEYKPSYLLKEEKLLPLSSPYVDYYIGNLSYAINANSNQKEGAWEFIHFLMSETSLLSYGQGCTTSRAAFSQLIDREMKRLADRKETAAEQNDGTDYEIENITDEWVAEYTAMMENALDLSPSYIRAKPILNIISEEAESYFSDDKSMEEIQAIIQNRVQLYLNERN